MVVVRAVKRAGARDRTTGETLILAMTDSRIRSDGRSRYVGGYYNA